MLFNEALGGLERALTKRIEYQAQQQQLEENRYWRQKDLDQRGLDREQRATFHEDRLAQQDLDRAQRQSIHDDNAALAIGRAVLEEERAGREAEKFQEWRETAPQRRRATELGIQTSEEALAHSREMNPKSRALVDAQIKKLENEGKIRRQTPLSSSEFKTLEANAFRTGRTVTEAQTHRANWWDRDMTIREMQRHMHTIGLERYQHYLRITGYDHFRARRMLEMEWSQVLATEEVWEHIRDKAGRASMNNAQSLLGLAFLQQMNPEELEAKRKMMTIPSALSRISGTKPLPKSEMPPSRPDHLYSPKMPPSRPDHLR